MSKTYYMPRTDAEKVLWLKNFANKLPGYTNKYGLVAADATEAQKCADFFAWILDARNHAVRYVRSAACRRTDKNGSPNQQSCEKELLLNNTNNGAKEYYFHSCRSDK